MNRISSLFSFLANKIGNVTMGTSATTLTGAIAEHESDLATMQSSLNTLFIAKDYSYAYTNLAAGGTLQVTGTMFNTSTPSGYTVMGIRRATSGHVSVALMAILAYGTGSSTVLNLKNTHTSAVSGTASISVIYARNAYFNT